MTTRWSFLTSHADALLAFEADPDVGLMQVAEDLGASYRWMVGVTTDLMAAGFLERERRGRAFSYFVTKPEASDVLDERAVRVQQLGYALDHADGPVEDRADVEDAMQHELEYLRHEIVVQAEHLRHLQVEARHLESAIERARAILRHPSSPPLPAGR